MPRHCLLVSDLDGTLLGDDDALDAFSRWRHARAVSLRVVYASGRFFESVSDSVRTTALPEPAAVAGGVGADLRSYPDGERFAAWQTRLGANWDAVEVQRVLARFEQLELQPAEFLSDFKVSYYVFDATQELLAQIRRELEAAGLSIELVYSSGRDLDVMPSGVSKGSAARFLAEHWGYAVDDVIVAGDSGNDLSMFAAGFRGVVVANAQAELRSLLAPNVYQASQPHAAGVLEGIEHWLTEPSLEHATR